VPHSIRTRQTPRPCNGSTSRPGDLSDVDSPSPHRPATPGRAHRLSPIPHLRVIDDPATAVGTVPLVALAASDFRRRGNCRAPAHEPYVVRDRDPPNTGTTHPPRTTPAGYERGTLVTQDLRMTGRREQQQAKGRKQAPLLAPRPRLKPTGGKDHRDATRPRHPTPHHQPEPPIPDHRNRWAPWATRQPRRKSA
jgi:hypothetical protein